MDHEAAVWVARLGLQVGPDGVYSAEFHRAAVPGERRALLRARYFLLTSWAPRTATIRGPADALYFHHAGGQLRVRSRGPGGEWRVDRLGPPDAYQVAVAGGAWRTVELVAGSWALIAEAQLPGDAGHEQAAADMLVPRGEAELPGEAGHEQAAADMLVPRGEAELPGEVGHEQMASDMLVPGAGAELPGDAGHEQAAADMLAPGAEAGRPGEVGHEQAAADMLVPGGEAGLPGDAGHEQAATDMFVPRPGDGSVLSAASGTAAPVTGEGLIAALGLRPHGEGGHFGERWRAAEAVETVRGPRSLGSTIYYLLSRQAAIGYFHRNTFDITHLFHSGGPIVYWLISPEGAWHEVVLGHDGAAGQVPSFTCPGGFFKSSHLVAGAEHGLISEIVAPGFDYADHTMADADLFEKLYPQHRARWAGYVR